MRQSLERSGGIAFVKTYGSHLSTDLGSVLLSTEVNRKIHIKFNRFHQFLYKVETSAEGAN